MASIEIRSIDRLNNANANKSDLPEDAILLNNIPIKAYCILIDIFKEFQNDLRAEGVKAYNAYFNRLIGSIDADYVTEQELTYFSQISFWIMDAKTLDRFMRRAPIKVEYVRKACEVDFSPAKRVNEVIAEIMVLLNKSYIIAENGSITCYNMNHIPLFEITDNPNRIGEIKIPGFMEEG